MDMGCFEVLPDGHRADEKLCPRTLYSNIVI